MDSFLAIAHDHCWLIGYGASSFLNVQRIIIVDPYSIQLSQ